MSLRSTMLEVLQRSGPRPAFAERRVVPLTSRETATADRALLEHYRSVTFDELRVRILAAAVQLSGSDQPGSRRVLPGQRVAFLGAAGVDYCATDLGAQLAGLVTVPLQTSCTIEQQLSAIREVDAAALVVSQAQLGRAEQLVAERSGLRRLIVLDHRGGDPEDRRSLQRLAEVSRVEPEVLLVDGGSEDLLPPDDRSDDDPALVLYTSGSTGSPKGALYTQRLVEQMWGGEGWSEFFAEDPDVVAFHYMPMSHVAGHSSVRSVLARGGLTCFASTTDLSSFLVDLRRAEPTELSLVPRVCELLRQEHARRARALPDEESGSILETMRADVVGGRITWASCTSAPVSAELKAFVEALLGIEVHELYGTTEIGGVLADGRFLRPPVQDFRLEDAPEIGYLSTDRPRGRGELLVKSTSTVPGYYGRPDLRESIFTDDGFYRTGDIAAVDDDGLVSIIDRRSAVVKLSQGEFVALAALEAMFVAHSELIDQAYLQARPGQSFVVAVVVPTASLRVEAHRDPEGVRARLLGELRRVAADQQLSAWEVPRGILVELEPFSETDGLLSDHRKPVRPRLSEKYAERLLEVEARIGSGQDEVLDWLHRDGPDAPILLTLRRAVAVSLGIAVDDVPADARFRDLGGDSLTAVALSRLLSQILGIRVPVDTVVSASMTLTSLASALEARQKSDDGVVRFEQVHGTGATILRAADLTLPVFLGTHDRLDGDPAPSRASGSVLITGASGFLGAILVLEQLRRARGTERRVVALVRADDRGQGRDRIESSLSGSSEALRELREMGGGLDVVVGDLSQRRLGLADEDWSRLADEVREVIHAGAMVNHALGYEELFASNVGGTAEVIRLATVGRRKHVTFLSSIATALMAGVDSPLDEQADLRDALAQVELSGRIVDGYAASKWAGEVLLREAHEHLGLDVTVVRASMILAHRRLAGQINVPDSFTRLMSSVLRTGLAPESFYAGDVGVAHYDGLPADVVASIVLDVAARATDGFDTVHVVNPHDDGVSLDAVVDRALARGADVRRVPSYAAWLRTFRSALQALGPDERRTSMLPLLGTLEQPEPATHGSLIESRRLRELSLTPAGLDDAYLDKVLDDLENLMPPRST